MVRTLNPISQEGILHIVYVSPVELDVDEHVYKIQELVREIGAQRLIFDSISSFEIGMSDKVRYTDYIWGLTDYFKCHGVSVLMTHEMRDSLAGSAMTKHGISFVADNLLLLAFKEEGLQLKRYLKQTRGYANLAIRAVQSLGETGIVKISLRQINEMVEVRIQDNGLGFASGVLDQLFTPFFTTKERGTGLGLAVVKAIIHNHDGEIEASNMPQGGALFTFTLPIASFERKEVDVALIIQDKILGYSLEKALNALDYRVKVLEMKDFENGTIDINDILPKIVIIEGSLDEDTLIKLEDIHKYWPRINMIVMGDFPQKKAKVFQEKGIRIIAKPFEITQIISTIKNSTFVATQAK